VTDPRRILCAGVNYDEHRVETGRDPSANPTIFTRYPSSLVGHGSALVKPRESDAFDYEGELAVVIGRAGRRVPVADALAHVAGYSAFMDGSVRDWQRMTSQFTPGKNFDASGAFGPWLLTADEVADPQALHLRTIVDGDVLQEAGTELMIFSVAELIAFCSTFTTLEPGDVIATGTPGGVGDRRTPPRYLVPGSRVTVDITGVGCLENNVISD
jgi:2-keto-4-pentenoate hydratase/2-oxohepta-3-ene-1,7-dioic acid hydratase in catechol pathway